MQKYKWLNNILGWIVFAISSAVYVMTAESSGSFWDCGEFVSCCFKLQVAHPPGAPFFMLVGKLFTLLSMGDVTRVAFWVNVMSALCTSGAILFTFWTVTALARKVVIRDGAYTDVQIYTVLGAGFFAALCGTFLDSLWFSAVEGEVYAMSQFFASISAWGIMKWDATDDSRADRWLLFIALMIGLSIGVHLLPLLVIPFIALIYYYKRYTPSVKGFLIAGALSFVILGIVMKGVISQSQAFMAGFDKFFVNSLGLPLFSGSVFFILLLITALTTALYWTRKRGKTLAHTLLLCLSFVYIGYTTIAMVPIRAKANPPINMNRPVDPFAIKSYVDREQYGDRPLLRGPDYTATSRDITGMKVTGEKWYSDPAQGKYIFAGDKQDYEFRPESEMLFPRLGFWQEESKKQAYRAWLNPRIDIVDADGNIIRDFPPGAYQEAESFAASGNYEVKDHITMGDNLRFFFQYQVGYMYMRYLMWNFAGRQNDIQGTYGNDDGGWICGIPLVDQLMSGVWGHPKWPQDKLSESLASNKAKNKFYLIPLILGVIGILFTFTRDEKTFWVILALFVTTGLLQIVYQNEPPIEPRERDYAQAGSFLAFCFWIGFGFIAIVRMLSTRIPAMAAVVIAVLICLPAPYLMGSEGWDDHNRHNRFTARDFAVSYLESCQPNAILFTQGDNDTYPLWYAQEVEGIRTDVRIVNLSLLGVDWYIDQLRYKMNNANPVKMTFTAEQTRASNRDVVRYSDMLGQISGSPMELSRVMQFIASDAPEAKVSYRDGTSENFLPTKTFFINVDTHRIKDMDMVSPADYGKITPVMQWSITNSMLVKNDLLTLDIVANNLMERPIYFAVSVSPDAYLGLEKYFQLEGLTYRIVPIENPEGAQGRTNIHPTRMYDNMMTKFRFGGIETHDVYLDENIMRMTVNVRGNYGRLAEGLLERGEKEKAVAVIDHAMNMLPTSRIPLSVFNYTYPNVYYSAGAKDKGRKLLEEMVKKSKNELNYFKSVYRYQLDQARDRGDFAYLERLQQGGFTENRALREQLYILQEMGRVATLYESMDYATKVAKEFEDYRNAFYQLPAAK